MSEQACPCGKDSKSCPAASSGQNGKGDSPRNISKRFRKNYDSITWSAKPKKSKPGEKFVKVY